MDKVTENLAKLPRFVKVGAGLATVYAALWAKNERDPRPVVSVLPLHGVIIAGKASPLSQGKAPINMENLKAKIDQAFKPKKLDCVVLSINSPGGAPVQCDLISSYLLEKAKEKGVPVVAFVEDVAASGGYWLACSAGEIYCARSSIVGSIGVIGGGFGFTEGMLKVGVERRVFTAGNSKSQLDPFQPLKEEDVVRQQAILDGMHTHFIDHVKGSRGEKLKAEDEKLFNGEYWTGEVAEGLGLVDGVQLLESWLLEKYGDEKKVRVIRINASGGLRELLGGLVLDLGLRGSLGGILGEFGTVPVVGVVDPGVEAFVEGAFK